MAPQRPEHKNTQWFLAGAKAFALKPTDASAIGDTDKILWLT
jgi:hypothetical protein